MMDVAQYPHISKMNDKSKIHREVYKQAYPENFVAKVVKNEDLRLV